MILLRLAQSYYQDDYASYLMEITVKQMYDIENAGHAMGFHKILMMENAGAASVQRLLNHIEDISSKTILVVAGMGNNGGDGLVMARHLAGYGAAVTLVLMGRSSEIKTVECQQNYDILSKMPSIEILDKIDTTIQYDIIIDAMLGTGITGDIREPYNSAISYINDSESFVLSVDVPSGLNPDTGNTCNTVTYADVTVTFHKMKRGIHKRPDITGTLYTEAIGIPPEAEEGII